MSVNSGKSVTDALKFETSKIDEIKDGCYITKTVMGELHLNAAVFETAVPVGTRITWNGDRWVVLD